MRRRARFTSPFLFAFALALRSPELAELVQILLDTATAGARLLFSMLGSGYGVLAFAVGNRHRAGCWCHGRCRRVILCVEFVIEVLPEWVL